MGNCMSVSAEEREQKQRNTEIERDLRKAAKEYENTVKILLLGKWVCENIHVHVHACIAHMCAVCVQLSINIVMGLKWV